ncbi:MAG: S8 family peptidase [Bdellovibrionota bacterium]
MRNNVRKSQTTGISATKNKVSALLVAGFMVFAGTIFAAQNVTAKSRRQAATPQNYLVKLAEGQANFASAMAEFGNAKVQPLFNNWVEVTITSQKDALQVLRQMREVEYAQPNYAIKLIEDYQIHDPIRREAFIRSVQNNPNLVEVRAKDNPAIPAVPAQAAGNDPLEAKQWGMIDIGAKEAWSITMGKPETIVAVIDTGVDYTHEDLVANIWRNAKEIPNNNIDDDQNGYVDDVIGWDFVSNDNKPYDLAASMLAMVVSGGNPGHGTHCAGNVAAKGKNAIGISGVAPNVTIMPLRFISDKGSGTTADAIKAVKYAVDNGARILSNSWGSEGEDPAEAEENKALREVVQYAQDKGALFIAAAGNGHMGVGYDNDADPKPSYPSSYEHDNIISVAAMDVNGNLGAFSNWGPKSVDIGAPGVAVFSTVVQSQKYSDTVIDFMGIKATWDGTSMACPHVAGAAALYWSAHPEKTWQEVKQAILSSAAPTESLKGKVTSGGRLNIKSLMRQ